ncbi:hypothetical protein CEXT_78731 [Caerostris extrusa]|uniref:Uncharacterized protein n=1 Tax=Caerostris extrusa TaxID=172846 RepID=A0AAV4NTR5_CAEEX|nr:hypothetical protein CEXT_78731 [Caerostris extrusa]
MCSPNRSLSDLIKGFPENSETSRSHPHMSRLTRIYIQFSQQDVRLQNEKSKLIRLQSALTVGKSIIVLSSTLVISQVATGDVGSCSSIINSSPSTYGVGGITESL